MKIIIVLLLFFANVSFAKIDKSKDKKVDQILEVLEFNKFVKAIKKIKSYEDPSEIDELDYEMKMFFNKISFWYYFDPVDYQASLKRNIRINFDHGDINEISAMVKNPFLGKMIKNMTLYRDVFAEYHNLILIDVKPEPVMESRLKLLNNLWNVHGMDVQKDLSKKRISGLLSSGLVTVPMLGKKDDVAIIETSGLEKRNENLDKYLKLVLGQNLKNFRHYEIREYLRILDQNPVYKKFSQLVVNYHVMYLYNYMVKVESDKLKELKALKASTREKL